MNPSTPQRSPHTGDVSISGEQASLTYRRQLAAAPSVVWAAITEPEQLRQWFMTKAVIDGRKGGSVDMVSGASQFHVTGKILNWDPPRLYEYEWNVDPRPELPKGERAFVRWELAPSAGGTLLTITHGNLTRGTALGFAPGMHAFLDRLEAQVSKAPLPDWMKRYAEVAGEYPKWQLGDKPEALR